jgi:hypothetical protein
MYKLTLYFKDNNAIVFEINSIKELDDLLKTYPEYTKMALERIKTLKR